MLSLIKDPVWGCVFIILFFTTIATVSTLVYKSMGNEDKIIKK
jgi:hypothetical protein